MDKQGKTVPFNTIVIKSYIIAKMHYFVFWAGIRKKISNEL